MAVRFEATLASLREEGAAVPVAAFSLQEEYGSGWTGTAILAAGGGLPLSLGQMLGAVLASGIDPGAPMDLRLTAASEDETDELHGRPVRSWPCMVSFVEPFHTADDVRGASCRLRLADPVTHLARQPLWGCYRACSAGEAVGGALSMAAGGDGKPSLEPLLPGLPRLRVVEETRGSLGELPYVVAAGQPLGQWLGDVLGCLGLRAQLQGASDGTLSLVLSDGLPTGRRLSMTAVSSSLDERPDEASSGEESWGPLLVGGYAAYPGMPSRGSVLDNPVYGSPLQVGTLGAVDAIFTGTGVDLQEAQRRNLYPLLGEFTEMLRVSALSRQPALRPGRLLDLSRPIQGIRTWQVARAAHHLRGGVYDNDVTLLNGEFPWHPQLPRERPPAYVSAMVDAGPEYATGEPVPRDRLGRIHVSFPFAPSAIGEEARQLAAGDADGDGRITLADFTDEQASDYEENAESWEDEKEAYQAGEYEDPYPGHADADLSDEQLLEREENAGRRQAAVRYMAYRRARETDVADRDRDGYVSDRDRLVSDELATALRDDERREELEEQQASREAGTLEDDHPDLADDEGRMALLDEYGALFGTTGEPTAEELMARRDAALEAERWPPRVPLTVVEPMAGHLHGFIPGHRQGDVCRVAVHGPFAAEIVGFQYRSDRRINAGIAGAVAGMVVEHNAGEAWSGLVFRRTEQLEEDRGDGDEAGGGEGAADGDEERPDA